MKEKVYLEEKIYQEEFQQRVLQAEHPVVVDFFADWCGPCKMLAPVLEQLERDNDEVEFFKINIDENPEIAEQYEVMSIPNVGFFKGGELVDRSVGFKSADEMQSFIDSNK